MANEKRLIDANALVDLVLNHPRPYRRDFYAMINNAPTVDAVEVVHGRWIGKNSPYDANIHICSVCREQISILGNKLRFCPNCGAKMDGDGNA